MKELVKSIIAQYEYDPDCTSKQFEEVLASLDRWSLRTRDHVTYSRRCPRFDYHTWITVSKVEALPVDDGTPSKLLFQLMSRNLSQSGIGILSPPVFVPRLLSDATPLVRSESAFQVGAEVNVTIDPKTGRLVMLRAVITRLRSVHLGFIEAGLRFVERDTPPFLG